MTSSPDPRKRLTNDPGAQYASPVSPRPDPLPSDEGSMLIARGIEAAETTRKQARSGCRFEPACNWCSHGHRHDASTAEIITAYFGALPTGDLLDRVADVLAEQADCLHARNVYEDEAEQILAAIDMPRREAEVRAATLHAYHELERLLDEIAGPVGRIRLEARGTGIGYDADKIAVAMRVARSALAYFNPEAGHGPIGAYATLAIEEAEAEREAAANPEAE